MSFLQTSDLRNVSSDAKLYLGTSLGSIYVCNVSTELGKSRADCLCAEA